jgi:hypothetical protein
MECKVKIILLRFSSKRRVSDAITYSNSLIHTFQADVNQILTPDNYIKMSVHFYILKNNFTIQ